MRFFHEGWYIGYGCSDSVFRSFEDEIFDYVFRHLLDRFRKPPELFDRSVVCRFLLGVLGSSLQDLFGQAL